MARPDVNFQIMDFEQAKQIRSPHENDWRLASAYCLPQHYGSWTTDGPVTLGNQQAALRRTVFDSTGQRSLPKYMAILERLATPIGSKYHTLESDNPALNKSYRVRTFFGALNDLVFKRRYGPRANFRASSNEVYASMGTYGTAPLYIGPRIPNALSRQPSMLYKACSLRNIYIMVNAQGEVYKVFRRYWLNLHSFEQEFPNVELPRTLALEKQKPQPNQQMYVECVHIVQPQPDFDPEAWDQRRMPFVSYHVCITDKQYIDAAEGGYRSMPYVTPRTFTMPEDAYGFAPAVAAIASMGGASTVKKAYLKQGNLAAEPAILAADDGVLNGTVDIRPAAINYGGIDRMGRKLIDTLQPGRWDINEHILEGEQSDIEDSFFVTLFQILTETPEMTATEVLERVAEKAALLSPTMGRLQTEFLGPTIERELNVFDELGWLGHGDLVMPPELIEAAGEYQIQYTSPMAKSQYAEEVSGFARAVEFALSIVEATQDPSHLDHFEFDTAIPEMADKTAVPTRWMASPEQLSAKREQRGQQQQTQQMIEAAPAVTGALKAVNDMNRPKA